MSCGCTDPCQPNSIPCTCEARVTSDCVTVSGATSNCLAIDDNLLLTDYLTQMDERICEKVDSITNFIALENVGTGSELYKGDNLLGKKQIRTVKSIDPNLVVTETADEIQLDLNIPAIVPPDGTETKLVSGTNTTVVGNGSVATPYSVNVTLDGSETKVVAGTNTTITGNGTISTPYIINSTSGASVNDATSSVKGILKLTRDLGGTADAPTTPTAVHKTGDEVISGQKTFTAYTNQAGLYAENSPTQGTAFFTITQNANPAIFAQGQSSTGSVGVFSANILSSGDLVRAQIDGTNNNLKLFTGYKNTIEIYKVDNSANVTANSYIKTGGTSTQMLMADGSVKESQDNLQKQITTNTTLSNSDNNYTIFINNGATPITITINSSVTLANFCVGFIQEGTGDVTFVGSGVSLTNPVGLKSKGQGYATFIERKLNTTSYFLLGDTKP